MDKSKGPVLAVQGRGSTLESGRKVVPEEILGGLTFPEVTVRQTERSIVGLVAAMV